MIDALAAPIRDLIGAFGPGVLPEGGPDVTLGDASAALSSVTSLAAPAVSVIGTAWSGAAADAAGAAIHEAGAAADGLARHGDELRVLLDRATDSVRRGVAELTAILESFLGCAAAAIPSLVTPAGQAALVAVAADHLQRAMIVAARLRSGLDAYAAEAHALTAPPAVPSPPDVASSPAPAPASTSPASVDPVARTVESIARAASTTPASIGTAPVESSGFSGYTGRLSDTGRLPETAADGRVDGGAKGHRAYDPRTGGAGVEIQLPDGSTAIAPNERAADAVRAALEQQGTPYVWGGTTPGSGLDCSGLTQYAYREAGVDIPRLAADQAVGVPVDAENLLPGDLAVWDGHVAMVVGNGQLVEAGDPVEVGPIRTSNAGMSFHGFFRPTE